MSETRARYLHVVRSTPADTPAASDDAATRSGPSEGAQAVEEAATGEDAAPSSTATPAAATLQQAIMYAAVGWLALCVERTTAAVDIQPIAEGLYEVSAHFDEERTEGIILRVRLEVAPGLVMRTVVEPVRP